MNIKINSRSVLQFLGVIINENFTWSDHPNVILNKTNKTLGVIRRLAKSLPKDVLQTLYITLIETYLQYCNSALAINKTASFDTLLRMQKTTIRLITGNTCNSHTGTLFKYSDILRLSDINRWQVRCFVYQAFHSHLPESFNNYFVTN